MAIAFDAAGGTGSASPGGSITYSHTVSGSNRILLLSVHSQSGSISATYNGVAMTQVTSQGMASGAVYLFYLIAPDTGTNNVVVTRSGGSNNLLSGHSASYTGVKQTSPIDVFDSTSSASAGSLSKAITTATDLCWVVIAGGGGQANVATDTSGGNASRATGTNNSIGDSAGAKSPAGSFTGAITMSPNDFMGIIVASFKQETPILTATLTETLTHTDTVNKMLTRIMTEGITFTDVKIIGHIFIRTFTEALTFTDTIAKAVYRGLKRGLSKMRSNQQDYPLPMDDDSIL